MGKKCFNFLGTYHLVIAFNKFVISFLFKAPERLDKSGFTTEFQSVPPLCADIFLTLI